MRKNALGGPAAWTTKAVALAICLMLGCLSFSGQPRAAETKHPVIVLIGGPGQGYPEGEHDYVPGILKIQRLIQYSPQFAGIHPVVKAFPMGFPADLTQISDADVIVLYYGLDYNSPGMPNPLASPAVRDAVSKLMAKGVGLVALHQSFSLSNDAPKAPYEDWLGAARYGLADRTTESAVMVVNKEHPIGRGLSDFERVDEYYPTLTFSRTTKVTPVLTAKVHVQTRGHTPVFEEPSEARVIAWAAERPDGGRAFGYSGAHYLASLDIPGVRTLLLNAILWTAKVEVPNGGAWSNALPLAMHGVAKNDPQETVKVILPRANASIEPQPWGKLEWFASRALGNSTTMTVGRATILPGKANPPHRHPNCVEILHVQQGHIMHRVGDREYEMRAGDTVTIPQGVVHNARNIGRTKAILLISFSSADRISVGE